MFYEVRVKDSKGKIKKVISSKSLSEQYWKNLDLKLDYDPVGLDASSEGAESTSAAEGKRKPGRKKKEEKEAPEELEEQGD
jgi:hypothetical protein